MPTLLLVAILVLLAAVLAWGAPDAPAALPAPPPTPKRPVEDVYHGVHVVDEYRWLEDASDPAVRAWSDAQDAYAHRVLDALPHVAEIRARVKHVLGEEMREWSGPTWVKGTLYAIETRPPREQPFLVALTTLDDASAARIVVDPNALDASGETSIDFYVPSRDGKRIAVSLSKGGTESGDVHVFDAATGRATGDVVPRVNGGTAGGSVAWDGEGTGFWYTRYPRGEERPPEDRDFFQQVWFHRLGTPIAEDRYEVGREFPRIAEVALEATPDGRYVLASVANGDGGEFDHWLRAPDGTWTRVAAIADRVVRARLGRDGKLYLLSRLGAPRGKVLSVPLDAPSLAKAAVCVPESDVSIESIHPAGTALYVIDMAGGPNRLRVLRAGTISEVPVLPVSSVDVVVSMAGEDVLFDNESLLEPRGWYRVDAAKGTVAKTALASTSPIDFEDAEVLRDVATSADGTRVPLTILKRKADAFDGARPTLLYGYGGYGISSSPYFTPRNRIWLDQGGVVVTAHIRGGGELGEAWHLAGNLTKKQNVFDDFTACARHLVEKKVTRPDRLAIRGGSNGGLLMGAVLVQHPDLCKAVVSAVGMYDMLRVELEPNGAFNVTEFGTVKDPAHFRAMYAYSPFHHVVDGTRYPAVLMTSGWNDPRVNPYESRKMVARLQAATASGLPVLLRTTSNAGHGAETVSQRVAQDTDVLAFLFAQLGVDYR